jgi:general secretion pathway protein D
VKPPAAEAAAGTPAPAGPAAAVPGEQPAGQASATESPASASPATAPAVELSAAPGTAPAKPGSAVSTAGGIELNFKNVDILSFVQIMSQTMNVPMAWDEKDIRGKITVVSPRRFSKADAFRIFEAVLDMQGYSLIRREDSPLVQVVPSKDAARYPSPTVTEDRESPTAGGFVTQLIPLRYADANQVRAALQQIQSKTAAISVYAPGNLLIVSDTQDNIQRLISILHELDVEPGDVEYAVIRLKYGSSRLLATTLTNLLAGGAGGARRPQPGQPPAGQAEQRIVSDDRTNSLILVGDAFAIGKVRQLLEKLDVPGLSQNAGVRVFKLQHADSEEMTKILRDVRLSPSLGQPAGAPGMGAPVPAPVAGQAPGGIGGSALGTQFGSGTGITSDKPTNSLIVFGTPEFISAIEEMVSKLDVRRPQVFVQVLIMEMTLDKSLNLGVRWQATSPVGDSIIGAGNPNAAPQTLANAVANGQGAAIGVVGNTISFGGQTYTSFSGFIQATRQDQDLNVLANPQLLTLNNEEAEINVSQVIPVSAKILTNVNNQTTTEFEFKDVGIILKITPTITGDDKVRLAINQESSSIATQQSSVSISQNAITTLKRKLSTKVLVDDASVMAIGGLIQDQTVVSESKVPCLGDIPFLGWLFKSRSESIRKTNLIVFIRPQIIHTREDSDANTIRATEQYEETRGLRKDTENRIRRDMGLPAAPEPPKPK